jgi:hypothetical protein
VAAIVQLARATYRKMIQNLWWATGYNVMAIPLAAGVLYRFGILLSPAVGAALMAASTAVVAINARFLRVSRTAAGSMPAMPGLEMGDRKGKNQSVDMKIDQKEANGLDHEQAPTPSRGRGLLAQ